MEVKKKIEKTWLTYIMTAKGGNSEGTCDLTVKKNLG